jgi:hypothetical protein
MPPKLPQPFFAANLFRWESEIFRRVAADMVRFGFAFFAVWNAAQRRFVASIIRRRPEADMVLRGFDACTLTLLPVPFFSIQRRLTARPIRRRADALCV